MAEVLYSTEALERGILDIKKNIKVFEEQIEKERARIAEYRVMISQLEEKQLQERMAKKIEKSMNDG